MAFLLAICWYIVESTIIPPGFVKWFYLSFYIHPFFLFFCQIFLWIHLLWTCLLRLLSTLHRFTSIFFSFFFPFSFSSFIPKQPNTTTTTTTTSAHATAAQTVKKPDIVVKQTIPQPKTCMLINYQCYLLEAPTSEFQMISAVESDLRLEENHHHVHEAKSDQEEEEEEEEELANNEATGPIISLHDHLSSSFNSSSLTISNSSLLTSIVAENLEDDMEVVDNGGGLAMEEEDSDPFYQKYSHRMRWFDMLSQDRACGIGEIVEKELDICQNPNMFSSKMTTAPLLRSLESDLELVYVAHACLSWDALYHQHKKVEDVHAQNINIKYNYNYCNIVADRFQKFQVLLLRFIEENSMDIKNKKKKKMRHFNYVHSRLMSFNTLLQVPPLSEEILLESMTDEEEGGSSAIEVVVKGIHKCIELFWQYIRTTNNKKLKMFSWLASSSPVEDPKDIKLFMQLTEILKKKETWMKELHGKRRCCIRKLGARTVIEEESQKKEMMFTMIEMKLVAMVLNMSVVSSSHLKWCQHKLNSIHFAHGRRIITNRASPANSLFPVSN